ncbi:MAG: hypothetical protein U9N73_13510 [Candidatus Auribacterota bacterium]|nr:hypothetical protein [Candidatus Auribacterota bacterium]
MSSFTSNFKKYPFILLAGILVFFVTQGIIGKFNSFWEFCYSYSKPRQDDPIRLAIKLKEMPAAQNKVFLTGSSQTREGFDVKYLNERFEKDNLRFYNLGISGDGPPIDMFMLKEKFFRKDPDIIIYMPYVGSFYKDYDFKKMQYYFNPAILPYIIKYLGVKTLIENTGNLIDGLIGEVSFFYKYRSSFRSILTNYIYYRGEFNKDSRLSSYAVEDKPGSYYINKIEVAKKNNFPDKYYLSSYTELNKYLFIKYAKEIIDKKILFIVINSPTQPLIGSFYDNNIDSLLDNFLSVSAANLGFIYLSKQELPKFTEDDFADFTHLNSSGRRKLTSFLERYLKNG